MRFIKLGLISVVVLFILLTLLSLLFPSRLRITRDINIAASDSAVTAAITDLRAWDQWNEFVRSSQLTGKSWSALTAGKGAYLASDQLRVTITGVGRDSVRTHWEQRSGRSFDEGVYIFHMQPDSLTVQEWMEFHFKWYPWERLGILLYDKKLGPVMEESLTGLRRYVEKSR